MATKDIEEGGGMHTLVGKNYYNEDVKHKRNKSVASMNKYVFVFLTFLALMNKL